MIQVNGETSWKIWVGVGLLGCVLVYLATFSAGKFVQSPESPTPASYSYEMPRGETAEAPFDLSGREVHRQTLGDATVEEGGLGPVVPHVVPAKGPKASMMNGKNKKLTPAQLAAQKTKQIAEAAKKAKAAAVAKQKAVTEARRKRFEIQMYNERQRARMQAEMDAKAAQSEWNPNTISTTAGFETAIPADTSKADADKKDEDEDLNLSAAQWRTLLQVSPTAANVSKMIQAYSKKKLDAASFYMITKELLMDSAPDRRKAGLMLVSMAPTAMTYEFMVSQMNEMSPDVQTALKREIAKYSQPNLLGVTSQVISSSKEPAAVASAMGNLQTALENYKKQPASGTISSQGGTKTPGITQANLTQFLSGLARLSTSEDGAISQQAKNLTQSIQEIKK